MNKITLVSLLSGIGLLLSQNMTFAGVSFPLTGGIQFVPNQVLVKFKPGMAVSGAQFATNYGAQAMQAVGNKPDILLATLSPGQTVAQAVRTYKNDPNVAYAQPNYIYHSAAVPSDPQYGQQWAAKNNGQSVNSVIQGEGWIYPTDNPGTAGDDMNLESAWNVQTDCSTVVIAVVDSGINYNSTDLAANMWMGNAKHGQNFAADVATGAGSDPMDLAGHGTHVAGIIGAVGGNSIAGVGVCWKANLMAVRVLDATGTGSSASIISGIAYAVANGAKIINMSLAGTTAFDQAYSDAITSAQASNVLVVVAAGNDGLTTPNNDITPHWPCNFIQTNLLCVAALDQSYTLANFSDWGATSVDVGAPGTNILSTWAGTSTIIPNLISGTTPSGWVGSSTTSGSGGGWAYAASPNIGWLIEPNTTTWGTTLYNANTDDRVYKTFNLAGVNAATLEMDLGINVQNGDTFNVNYSVLGGDPFVAGGTTIASITTGRHDGLTAPYYSGINISSCISSTCSIGFQLISASASVRDIGMDIDNFKISTLTNNTSSYNTLNGTSMATPEVVGVAALVWAHNPLYTYSDVENAIKNGGRTIPSLSGKTTTGKAVDAMGALAYINPPTGIAIVVH